MDWRGWRETFRHSVLAASNRGNDALEWIMRVEVVGCTFVEFANSGEFETLDYKLHTALLNCIPKGPLKDKILKAAETEIQERRAIEGRQTLFLVYEYYGGYQDAGAAATIRHLAEVIWMGDNRMQEFLNLWDKVIRAINVQPSEVDLREFFLSNLRQSSVFVKELDEYEELPQEQKTYQRLIDMVNKYLARKDRRRIIKEAEQGIRAMGGVGTHKVAAAREPQSTMCRFVNTPAGCKNGDACLFMHPGASSSSAAAPAQSTEKGKGKGRGKGKGGKEGGNRSRSASTDSAGGAKRCFCHAFQTKTCQHDANTCQYEHRLASREELADLLVRKVAASKAAKPKRDNAAAAEKPASSSHSRSGKGKGKGKSRSPSVPNKEKLCWFIQEGQHCKFGDLCQYSHDLVNGLPYIQSKGKGSGKRGKSQKRDKTREKSAEGAQSGGTS